jgi:hypothetical protein
MSLYDYTVSIHESLIGIHPENPTAIQFLDEEFETEPWQFLGNTMWIDLRYANDVITTLKQRGFVVHIYV